MDNPYVGPRSFQEQEPLFGRARELRDLLDMLISERLVLLYAPSGTGKTSLLQAGLIPELRREGFTVLPPLRVGLPPEDGDPTDRYLRSVRSCLEVSPEGRAFAEELTREVPVPARPRRFDGRTSRHVMSAVPGEGGQVGTVLIFDQFEEIFTVDPTRHEARAHLFRELGGWLRNPLRWALFSMREEAIARLDPWLAELPTRLRARFRLDLLDWQGALEAVREPARLAGVPFTGEAAGKIVDELRSVSIQRPDGSREEHLGTAVEPVLLQVVCRQLWQRLEPLLVAGAKEIGEGDFDVRGSTDRALADYHAEAVADAARAAGMSERRLRLWCEQHLTTPDRLRRQVIVREDAPENDVPLAALTWLTDQAYLLRREPRGFFTLYELAHDRMVQPLVEDNVRWFAAHTTVLQEQAALWQREGCPEGLCFEGEMLARAEAWAGEHADELAPLERRFLEASLAIRARKERESERRNKIRRRVTWAVMGAALAIMTTLGISYYNLYGRQQELNDELDEQLAIAWLKNIALEFKAWKLERMRICFEHEKKILEIQVLEREQIKAELTSKLEISEQSNASLIAEKANLANLQLKLNSRTATLSEQNNLLGQMNTRLKARAQQCEANLQEMANFTKRILQSTTRLNPGGTVAPRTPQKGTP